MSLSNRIQEIILMLFVDKFRIISLCVRVTNYKGEIDHYRHCPVLNFFSTLDAVLNGLSNPTLEDGFNTRIFFLFTF